MKVKKITSTFKLLKTIPERARGLMFSSEKKHDKPLLFDFRRTTSQCTIHSFFCFFEFDAIWLDEEDKITFLIENVKPWKYGLGPEKARWLIEAKKGTIRKFKLKKGDRISL